MGADVMGEEVGAIVVGEVLGAPVGDKVVGWTLVGCRLGESVGEAVDGEAVGAINRVPAAGETRSNMHVGGLPEKTGLTARDQEICDAIGPLLRDKGQIFVGIDVIGDYLTEINVTSPTGLQELDRFDGINAAGLIWDAIEKKL